MRTSNICTLKANLKILHHMGRLFECAAADAHPKATAPGQIVAATKF